MIRLKTSQRLSFTLERHHLVGRKAYGATSGASIEVKHNIKWISSQKYKDNIGHWPSGTLPHRLVPDKGTYNEYLP